MIVICAIILAGITHKFILGIHDIILLNNRIEECFCAVVVKGLVRNAIYIFADIEKRECFIWGFQKVLIICHAVIIDQQLNATQFKLITTFLNFNYFELIHFFRFELAMYKQKAG